MRAAFAVLVLLAALPVVDAAPWTLLSHRAMDGPGWWAESFQLVGSNGIAIVFSDRSDSEIVGHILALYDGSDRLLAGATYFSVGGQPVEATFAQGDLRVTNEGVNATREEGVYTNTVYWTCDATCNPSRTFKLAVTSGGEQAEWGYGLFTQGATRIAATSGTDAWAYTTRQIEGDVAHVAHPFGGAHVVIGGSLEAHADDTMLATFVKASGAARQIRVEGPVTRSCPCFAGDWGPGDYTFRYEDVDARGAEGFLAFADVRLP